MYCFVVEVCSAGDGTVWQVEASQLAFRHTSVVNGKLLHNGCSVMIRGVNRHEHDAYNGKVLCTLVLLVVHTCPRQDKPSPTRPCATIASSARTPEFS